MYLSYHTVMCTNDLCIVPFARHPCQEIGVQQETSSVAKQLRRFLVVCNLPQFGTRRDLARGVGVDGFCGVVAIPGSLQWTHSFLECLLRPNLEAVADHRLHIAHELIEHRTIGK